MAGETPWTPGPWEWNEGGRLFHNEPAKFYSENILVIHDPVWRPKPADKALIAAAPEMAAALQYARNLIGPDEVIDALLAKIGGAA